MSQSLSHSVLQRQARPDRASNARKGEAEGRLFARAGSDEDISAVEADDVLDDGKAEARAAERAAARLVHAVETLEEMRQVLGGDADAEVRDRHRDHQRQGSHRSCRTETLRHQGRARRGTEIRRMVCGQGLHHRSGFRYGSDFGYARVRQLESIDKLEW